MPTPLPRYNLLICTYLEPELVERIRAVDAHLNVIFRPDLMAPARYHADHYNMPMRSPEQEQEWLALLHAADILYDVDPAHQSDLPEAAPKVKWVQSPNAGIGQFVKKMGFDVRMPNTVFTTSSGVHARPLAEFVMMSLLLHYKKFMISIRAKERKEWERYSGADLEGRTLALVGMGRIGAEVARLCKALGMRVIGLDFQPPAVEIDQFYPPEQLHAMLPQADNLVIVVPHTPQTEGMIGEREIALLPQGAFFINIGRGAVVDEPALIAALQSGKLSGAALDVFAQEPLPKTSPLWEMPNVLISPHSASTSDRENGRITELFCDNLRRFLDGKPLRNVLIAERYF
jgi:glyoxylate/hydroxypyruvate reductase